MSLPLIVLGIMFIGLICYALFGGADFGAGVWDLLSGGTQHGMRRRTLIEHSIGPVWEANHVWIIFVLVVLWTCFSGAFVSVTTTLYMPLVLAAFGMIARGAAFAFRKSVTSLPLRRFLGAAFAISSLITPFFLGAIVGGVASGRVPPGLAAGNVVTSWLNPTSILGGIMAILVCTYLAAVFLCGDATREGETDLADQFRMGGLITAAITGAVGIGGFFVLQYDAPLLFAGLTGHSLPVIIVSVLAGGAAIVLLLKRLYVPARLASALAVAAVLVGWAFAQYPYVLPDYLTIDAAAESHATLVATLVVLIAGAVVLVPALIYLYTLFQKVEEHDPAEAQHTIY